MERAFQLTGSGPLRGLDLHIAPMAARRHGLLKNGHLIGHATFELTACLAKAAGGDQGGFSRLTGHPAQEAGHFRAICQKIEAQFDDVRSLGSAPGRFEVPNGLNGAPGRHNRTDPISSKNAHVCEGGVGGIAAVSHLY